LKSEQPGEGDTSDITWNFEKFLVNANGDVVTRFAPSVTPEEVAEQVDELESLAQQLQTAVAEASDGENNSSDSPAIEEVSSTEESVLEGIEAFQAQLQEQQQAAAVEVTTETEQAEDSSLEPEVLAGIEAFRTQLGQMQLGQQQ